MRPFAATDRHDAPRLTDELVPRFTAVVDDVAILLVGSWYEHHVADLVISPKIGSQHTQHSFRVNP